MSSRRTRGVALVVAAVLVAGCGGSGSLSDASTCDDWQSASADEQTAYVDQRGYSSFGDTRGGTAENYISTSCLENSTLNGSTLRLGDIY